MSYSDFLNTLIAPIQLFIDALFSVAGSLKSNYIFLTLFGITLFISCFWWFVNMIHDFFYDRIDEREDYINKYNEYVLYQNIQHEYIHRHRADYLDLKYDKYAISQQAIMDYFYKNKGVLEQFKLDNLKLSKQATLDFLNSNPILEQDINYKNYVMKKDTALRYMVQNKEDDILNRMVSIQNNRIAKNRLDEKDQLPEWFGKDVKKQPLSANEQKEMDDLISNF